MFRKTMAMLVIISVIALTCACGKSETTAYKGETDTNPDKESFVRGSFGK